MANITTLSIPRRREHLITRLEEYVYDRNQMGDRVSKSEIILDALEEFLDRQESGEQVTPQPPQADKTEDGRDIVTLPSGERVAMTHEQMEIRDRYRRGELKLTGPPEPAPVRTPDTDVYEYSPEAQAAIDAWAADPNGDNDSVVKERGAEGSEEGTTP